MNSNIQSTITFLMAVLLIVPAQSMAQSCPEKKALIRVTKLVDGNETVFEQEIDVHAEAAMLAQQIADGSAMLSIGQGAELHITSNAQQGITEEVVKTTHNGRTLVHKRVSNLNLSNNRNYELSYYEPLFCCPSVNAYNYESEPATYLINYTRGVETPNVSITRTESDGSNFTLEGTEAIAYLQEQGLAVDLSENVAGFYAINSTVSLNSDAPIDSGPVDRGIEQVVEEMDLPEEQKNLAIHIAHRNNASLDPIEPRSVQWKPVSQAAVSELLEDLDIPVEVQTSETVVYKTLLMQVEDTTPEPEPDLEPAVPTNNLLRVKEFEVYPNPSAGLITLELQPTSNKPIEIVVTDLTGRTLQQLKLSRQEFYTEQIDLSNQPAGMYFVIARQGKQSISRKVLIE